MLVKVATDKKLDGISKGKPARNKSSSFFNGSTSESTRPPRSKNRRKEKSRAISSIPAFTPWKVILASILIGTCGILYIAHVFQTQQILEEVNQLELEYNRASRHYHEKRLIYDRQTGPREIYRHARENGFVNAGPADQILILEQE